MGRKDQLYAQYVRIMQSADDPREIYLVLKKDAPMEKKYIRQWDNTFAGKDVIVTIVQLVRKKKLEETEASGPSEEEYSFDSPFWSADA